MKNKEKKMENGVVIWFNRNGFGFISWKKDGVEQKDMFVHYSDINQEGFKTLKKDDIVAFDVGVNHRGQPKAVAVTKTGTAAPTDAPTGRRHDGGPNVDKR